MRGSLQEAYGGRPLSTSLFSAHFGVEEPPSKFGLQRFSTHRAAGLDDGLRRRRRSSTLLAENPTGRLPAFGIANYGALDAGLSDADRRW